MPTPTRETAVNFSSLMARHHMSHTYILHPPLPPVMWEWLKWEQGAVLTGVHTCCKGNSSDYPSSSLGRLLDTACVCVCKQISLILFLITYGFNAIRTLCLSHTHTHKQKHTASSQTMRVGRTLCCCHLPHMSQQQGWIPVMFCVVGRLWIGWMCAQSSRCLIAIAPQRAPESTQTRVQCLQNWNGGRAAFREKWKFTLCVQLHLLVERLNKRRLNYWFQPPSKKRTRMNCRLISRDINKQTVINCCLKTSATGAVLLIAAGKWHRWMKHQATNIKMNKLHISACLC